MSSIANMMSKVKDSTAALIQTQTATLKKKPETYPDKIKTTIKTAPKKILPKENLLHVFDPTPDATSDNTRVKLTAAANPIDEGWQINKLKKLGKGGVQIRMPASQDSGPIKVKLENSGLKAKIPEPQYPKVKLTEVPKDWDKGTVLQRGL